MNALLLNRSAGFSQSRQLSHSCYANQLLALQLSDVQLESTSTSQELFSSHDSSVAISTSPAHFGGVNAIEIDKFEGRYLLSGGADSTVSIWDLEAQLESQHHNLDDESIKSLVTLNPIGSVTRSEKAHKFGITDVSWYPFDSYAFITSSFDATLKIYDSLSLAPKASFALDSAVYSHSMSPIAQHLLVACGTQYPVVRLVDLRSGAAVQALVAHTGAVLTTAWSPRDEHIVASGSSDGTIRLWDIRRSAGQLGVLDMEDSIGIPGYDRMGLGARSAGRGRAHTATVNGLAWTDDGQFLISTVHFA
jgi:DNA excision repair protein ERCC-8